MVAIETMYLFANIFNWFRLVKNQLKITERRTVGKHTGDNLHNTFLAPGLCIVLLGLQRAIN